MIAVLLRQRLIGGVRESEAEGKIYIEYNLHGNGRCTRGMHLHVRRCLEEVPPVIILDDLRAVDGQFLVRIYRHQHLADVRLRTVKVAEMRTEAPSFIFSEKKKVLESQVYIKSFLLVILSLNLFYFETRPRFICITGESNVEA